MISIRYILILFIALLAVSSCKKQPLDPDPDPMVFQELGFEELTASEQDSILQAMFSQGSKLKNTPGAKAFLIELTEVFDLHGQTELYLQTMDKLKQYAIQDKDTLTLAGLYSDLGMFYEYELKFDSAYTNFDQAEKLYQQLQDSLHLGKMAISKASILYDFGIYTESETQAIRALEFYNATKSTDLKYECFNLLGLILCELHEYEASLSYYEKSLQILTYIQENRLFSPEDITEAYAALYNNIGGVYHLKNLNQQALIQYNNAFKLDQIEQVNPLLYAALLNNRATAQMHIQENSEVLQDLVKAMQIRDSLSQTHELNMSYLRISDYYNFKKDTLTALNYARKALGNAQEIHNLLDQKEALKYLIRLDKTNQLEHSENYMSVSDSIRAIERQTQHKFARIAYETQEKESKIKLLQIRNRNTLGIAALATLLLLGFLGLVRMQYRNRQLQYQNLQQQADEKIYHMILQQQQLSEEAKNQERSRISSELHDGVINRIFTTRFNLMQLASPMQEYKDLLIDELQKAEADIRNVSHQLTQKDAFSGTSFKGMIEDLIKSQSNSFHTQFNLHSDKAVAWGAFSLDQRLQIFRIIQELLQNVNKYSKASSCTVWFLKKDRDLIIKVSDNGIGFDTQVKSKGIGFSNIQQRAQRIGAQLTMSSKEAQGSEISLILKDFMHPGNT